MRGPARCSCAGRAGRRTRCARAAGTAARISSSLSTCSWSSTMAKRDLGVVDREHELGGRRVLVQRHRDRAERLRRQHRWRTGAAGSRRRRPCARRASSPASRQAAGELLAPARRARPAVASARCRIPSRAAPRRCGRCGRVLEQQSREGGLARRSPCERRIEAMLGRRLTSCCLCDDNPREYPSRVFPVGRCTADVAFPPSTLAAERRPAATAASRARSATRRASWPASLAARCSTPTERARASPT